MQNDNLVEIEDAVFGYGARPVLKGINLTAKRGQVVAIMGSSGCGKTTLLRLIGGQVKPGQGTVRVAGESLGELDRAGLYRLRRKMGMLFQFGALFTDMSVFDNVAFQLREHTDLPEDVIRDLVLMKLQCRRPARGRPPDAGRTLRRDGAAGGAGPRDRARPHAGDVRRAVCRA